MQCSYCDIDNTSKGEYNYNNLISHRIHQEAAKYPDINFYIDIEGGEPTLDINVFKLKSLGNLYFKLFTNFKKPNIEKLNEFSDHSIIEISINCDMYNDQNIKNLRKINVNDNINVSVLVTRFSSEERFLKLIKELDDIGIQYGVSEAEDFNTLAIHETIFSKYKTMSRLKFNFYNYSCNVRHLDISCGDMFFYNCSRNYKQDILGFDAKEYVNSYSICKSRVCGIHDYQTSYKREKQ
jgi:MoaA/NifB/PqqE/SkfB family radical SAM enzyme